MTENPCNTPRQLADWATGQFENSDLYFGHGTDNARDEAAFLVLRALDLPFDVTDELLDRPVTGDQKNRILDLVRQRINTRRPAAYLLNEAWFAGMPFYVNEHVLVPRSPFAELIAEQFLPWCEPENINFILDIGTGSGCIAIASAVAFLQANVDAIDISDEALSVAGKNVEHYGLQDRITLIKSDLFEKISDRKYDLIIANPPYVDAEDMAALPAEYKHEPALGLYAGTDGLDIVRRILNEATQHLTENGILVVEVGNSQYALCEQYPDVPFIWLDFEQGGEGVFLLTREELQHWFG